jgi:hypothetical protein
VLTLAPPSGFVFIYITTCHAAADEKTHLCQRSYWKRLVGLVHVHFVKTTSSIMKSPGKVRAKAAAVKIATLRNVPDYYERFISASAARRAHNAGTGDYAVVLVTSSDASSDLATHHVLPVCHQWIRLARAAEPNHYPADDGYGLVVQLPPSVNDITTALLECKRTPQRAWKQWCIAEVHKSGIVTTQEVSFPTFIYNHIW